MSKAQASTSAKGKPKGDQDDEELLHPFRNMEDGQDRAANLNQTRSDDAVGQRDAVDPPVF